MSTIPGMMYDCRFFPDEIAGGREHNGICHNILIYFGNGIGPHKAEFHLGAGADTTNRAKCADTVGASGLISLTNTGLPPAISIRGAHSASWSHRCLAISTMAPPQDVGMKTASVAMSSLGTRWRMAASPLPTVAAACLDTSKTCKAI
jgi:hypothetical protein